MPASLDKKTVLQISACQKCYKNSDGNRVTTKTQVISILFSF